MPWGRLAFNVVLWTGLLIWASRTRHPGRVFQGDGRVHVDGRSFQVSREAHEEVWSYLRRQKRQQGMILSEDILSILNAHGAKEVW